MTIEDAQKRIENAKAEIVAAEAELKRLKDVGRIVKPSTGTKGFRIDCNGYVYSIGAVRYAEDAYAAGNWFPTREAAELEAKRRRLAVKLKEKIADFNDGWVPDWSDKHQFKFTLVWSTRDSLVAVCAWVLNQPCDPSLIFKDGDTCNFGFTNSELKLIITGEE